MDTCKQLKLFLPLALVLNFILYFTFIPLANTLMPGVFLAELMAPDSQGYIDFSSTRTAFYPTFLFIIHFIFKTYDIVPIFHLIIYSIAASHLCATIQSLFNRKITGWFLFIALILNPAIFKFHLQILTESLSLSILCGVLAVIAHYLKTRNPSNLIWAMVLASIGAGIRPSNYPLIIATAIFIITVWRLHQIHWKNAIVSLTPIPIFLTLAASLFYLKHGEFKTQSFLGHNLYGKVILFTDETVATQSPQSTKLTANLFKPIRDITKNIEISPVRFRLLCPTYDYSRYQALSEPSHQQALLKDINHRYTGISDTYLLERALEVIKAKPNIYAQDVLLNFLALWMLWDLNTTSEQQEIEHLISNQDIQRTPYIQAIVQKPHVVPSALLFIIRTALALLMAYTMGLSIMILFAPHRLSETMLYLAFISLSIHGTYLLIALTQAGLSRYALSMWPGLFIIGLMLYINPLIKRKP